MTSRRLNAGATGLDLNNAAVLAIASQLTYEPSRPKLRSRMRQLGFRRSRTIMEHDVELVVARSDEAILVAFRGTEPTSLEDWSTDFRFVLTGGPLGMVHEGFADALGLVWRQLFQAVENYQDAAQPLWFTGHSLGAALATLATARCIERAKPVQGLYTFGSPRLGDSSFAERFNQKFNKRVFRFVNNNDIVTRVPVRLMNYRHVGDVCYFDSTGKLDRDSSAWDRFLDRMKGRADDVRRLGPDGIKDHSMDRYVELVTHAAEESEGGVE